MNNIRYADDTVLIADTEAKLQTLLTAVHEKSNEYGIRINIRKTETMTISKNPNPPTCHIYIDNTMIKYSQSFVYLGSTLTKDGKCDTEIRKRIAIAKRGFSNMKNILSNLHLNITTRIRTLKAYIFSTLTYGSETWTLNKENRRRIEAAKMWCLRRMLRVPWTARVTNQEILRRTNTKRSLLETIRRRQMNFLGHTLRRKTNEHLCLTGKIEGKRARGRQRLKYVQSLLEDIEGNITPVQLIRTAEDRSKWRGMTVNVIDTALR